MPDNRLFSGVYPAIVSPVAEDGSVMESELRALVGHLSETGIRGLYVCGGTGEGVLLPVDTRKRILEVVIDESRRIRGRRTLQIMVHIGAAEIANTEELILHAQRSGADAVSSVPPMYFFYSKESICRYYTRISRLSELPLIIYASVQSGVVFTAEMLKELSGQPTIRGIKFTGYNFFELMRMRSVVPVDFSILNGGDEVFLFGLLAGANGGVGTVYNVMPGQFCRLYDAWNAGDIELARSIQQGINGIIGLIIQYPVIGAVKYMLERLGYPVGEPVFPNDFLSAGQKDELARKLDGLSWKDMCV